tara:strand:+ start:1144 stop:3360 length:2217 start_codon:yes stop_codon:yes gene_type:complete
MAIPHIVGGENAGIAFSKINGAFDMLENLETDVNVLEDKVRQILEGGTGGGTGVQGPAGPAGDSAYQVAVDNGYVGTEAQWLTSLRGPAGQTAYQLAVAGGFTGNQTEWIASLKGPKGDQGIQGPVGPAGSDANVGTLPADVAALQTRADDLQAQIDSIEIGEANLGTLPDDVDVLRQAVNDINQKIILLEAEIEPLAGLITTVEANRANLQSQIDSIEVGDAQLGTLPADVAALQTAMPLKAPINNPTFTGVPRAPTRSASDRSDNIATTYFVGSVTDPLLAMIQKGSTSFQRVVTPQDDLAAIINDLSFNMPKSTSDNSRSIGAGQITRLILTPGKHKLTQDAIVTFDGLHIVGSGVSATEIQSEGGSALQIGVDASTSSNCINPKGTYLADFALTLNGSAAPQFVAAKDGEASGFPRGVLDIRFFSWSVAQRLYIKNYTPVVNSGGIYLSGYQWASFNDVHVDGFGRYCVCLDSQSPETWEVQLKFTNCQFMQGNTYDTDVSSSVMVHSTNRYRTSSFSALDVTFDACHFALYPVDGNFTRETRSIWVNPAISGVDIAISAINGCLFENHLRMIDIKSDVVFILRNPTMFGNGRTIDAVAHDNYQVKYMIDSPLINACQNGIMSVGRTVISGHGKMTGITGTKVRMTGSLRMSGEIYGMIHDYREPLTATQIPDGATSVVVPIGLVATPVRFEISPSWNTSCWVSEVSATSVKINFSTPAPVGAKNVYFYCSCSK